MDPSITKLLEDDEDESMHSGADVEAFTAALNRDIVGDSSIVLLPSETGPNCSSSEFFEKWKALSHEENHLQQAQQQERQCLISVDQYQTQLEPPQHEPDIEDKGQQVDNLAEHDPGLLHPKQSQYDQLQQQTGIIVTTEKHQNENSELNSGTFTVPDRSKHSDHLQPNKVQNSSGNQASTSSQANNPTRRIRNAPPIIPFHMLIPILRPHIDKDRSMQLQTAFNRLRANEVRKEDFLRIIREIVGDQMLRAAAQKVQMQLNAQAAAKAASQQLSVHANQKNTESSTVSQVNASSLSQNLNTQRPPMRPHNQGLSTQYHSESNSGELRESENKSDAKGLPIVQASSTNVNMVKPERGTGATSSLTVNKPQHQAQFSRPPFSMYGNTNSSFHSLPYPRTIGMKPHVQDAQLRPTQITNVQSNTFNEGRRPQVGSFSHLTSHSMQQQTSAPWQQSTLKEQKNNSFPSVSHVKQEIVEQASESQLKPPFTIPDASYSASIQTELGNLSHGHLKDERMERRHGFPSSSSMLANQIPSEMATHSDPLVQIPAQITSGTSPHSATAGKTSPKKSSAALKKSNEVLGSSPPSSKKQKTTGAFLDQSIEQLNDVTAVSGVNLREEEEQLLSAPKEDNRASEATRRFVQEEEERLVLEKGPLQEKIADISSRCGIENVSDDVYRCLSLCMEERIRGLISSLIRISKQRVDLEKTRHGVSITSDVRHHILEVNKKAKEEWEKKQAEEAERIRKLNQTEMTAATDLDKDKEDSRLKNIKANKEEDDKMRTNAANVAARAAVGGDDMLSKWQLMAEQVRQKREGTDGASGSQPSKIMSRKPSSTVKGAAKEHQEASKKGSSGPAISGQMRKPGSGSGLMMVHPQIARNISVKDVISVLEREPQMLKSAFIYRLYERNCASSGGRTRAD